MTPANAILGFGFSNLVMLGWLGAAAAPLLIHLWSRRRYHEVSWAAIDFLLAAMRKNARRIRIEQWLLLAVRTMLILLIVFALAEPFLEQAGLNFVAGVPTHRVLVIDASFSMAYRPTDQDRFERAKELAVQIVEESTRGDAFTLLLLSSPPQVIVGNPAFESHEVVEEIENLQLRHAGADLPATLVKVEEILELVRRDHPRLTQQEVYFLTDLQRTTWAPEFPDREASTEFRRRSRRLAEWAVLRVIDLGQANSENLAVTEITTADSFSTIARDVIVDAQIRNFGRRTRANERVELFVDGRRAGEQHVDLEPGGQTAVSFAYRFDTGGDHAVEVRLGGDLLDVDNHRWLALPVKETVRVLCVNGKPAGVGFRGATDYLVVALEPSGEVDRAMIRPEVVPESAILELDLDRYDCIFLCNVGQFTSSEAGVLEDYLRHGGGLIFFLGDQVQPSSYNRHLAGEEPNGAHVLPARLVELVRVREDGKSYRFDPLDYRHPIVQIFRGQEKAGLLSTPVEAYYRLLVPDGSSAKVALAFEGGDPAIVEGPIHRGRSILVATSADVSWTPMPMLPSYVPIIQQLLATAVGGQLAERNLTVGETLGASVPSFASQATVTLRPPRGEPQSLRLTPDGRRGLWSYAQTDDSGVYSAELQPLGAQRQLFAVNVNPVESDLSRLSADALRSEVWADVDFLHQTSWQDFDERTAAKVSRRDRIHRWLLYGVLGLLFGETLLAWRFGHHAS